ncbi:LysE family translocator [Limibacillus sp. MBR-115]|jgi:threonine/homoserine/homoserine lactone efflux protein|uniref:LysE family translocator n=1 Tax=Limibacillus sp. MBR-115 TaxID=3156465 RepID=UPI003391CA25
MPSTEILLAFLLATAVFAYMPGPAMLYATAQTLARGKQAGWMAALGIHVGGYVHVLSATLGLAALFETVPLLYALMKIIGSGYLIWLGARLILNRSGTATESLHVSKHSGVQAFRQSVAVEVLNPKTALFYLAFLPQFTATDALLPLWAQLFVLGTIVNFVFSSADVLCVLLAARLSDLIRNRPARGRVIRRAGGGILIALGLNLALDRQ